MYKEIYEEVKDLKGEEFVDGVSESVESLEVRSHDWVALFSLDMGVRFFAKFTYADMVVLARKIGVDKKYSCFTDFEEVERLAGYEKIAFEKSMADFCDDYERDVADYAIKLNSSKVMGFLKGVAEIEENNGIFASIYHPTSIYY